MWRTLTPVITLAKVHGYDLMAVSAMIGRQLPFFSLLVPFWLIWAFCGLRGMLAIWPAILVAGLAFAIPQFLISNFHGPWLVDVGAAVCSMVCLTIFLRLWQPKEIWTSASGSFDASDAPPTSDGGGHGYSRKEVMNAWTPWLILSVIVLLWGIPEWKKYLDSISLIKVEWANLHLLVQKMPPVAAAPKIEEAIFKLNLPPMHSEIVKRIGSLRFRRSFSQNLLDHSIEVAQLMGIMAAELGVDINAAKNFCCFVYCMLNLIFKTNITLNR